MSNDPINPPSTPTVTAAQQLAETFVKQLDDMSAAMPLLQGQHPAVAPYARRRQSVPTDFVATVVAAAEQQPVLQSGVKPEEARIDMQFVEAFRPVLARLAALHLSLADTIRAKRAALGQAALQTYSIAKSLARNSDPVMLTHVANMQRDLKRKGIGKKLTPPQQTSTQQKTSTGPEPRGNAAQA